MNENEFLAASLKTLQEIALIAENEWDADCELNQGCLNIELGNGRKFVINRHAPTLQIWLASPLSGAWHFSCQNAKWLATKDPAVELFTLLRKEAA